MKIKLVDRQQIKNTLIAFGYLDNEWLDKYIELALTNINTQKTNQTQRHHIIPVTNYWTSTEPYNRPEAVKIANQDEDNFEINLLYKDHLLIHAYLTLCTNLDKLQEKYNSQTELRLKNSKIGANSGLLFNKTTKSAKIDEFIKENYYKMSLQELSEATGLSKQAVHTRRYRLDLSPRFTAKITNISKKIS